MLGERHELPLREHHRPILRDVLINGKHRLLEFTDKDWEHKRHSVHVPHSVGEKIRKGHRSFRMRLSPEMASQEGSGWLSFLGDVVAPIAATAISGAIAKTQAGGSVAQIPLTEHQIRQIHHGHGKVRVVHHSKITDKHKMVPVKLTGRQAQHLETAHRHSRGAEITIEHHQLGGAAFL